MKIQETEKMKQKQPNGKQKIVDQLKKEDEKINCAIWQDMKPVSFMSTVHDDNDFNAYTKKDRKRRRNVIIYDEELQKTLLRLPNPIQKYNMAIGYTDRYQ